MDITQGARVVASISPINPRTTYSWKTYDKTPTHEMRIGTVRRIADPQPTDLNTRVPQSSLDRKLRIAMVGLRGVPATYGGIEHHVEEIGARLAADGHLVTVFSRPGYGADRVESHRGMEVREVPALGAKHLEALSHSALSSVRALLTGYDIVHFHAIGPALFTPIPRLRPRTKVVFTVHGRDDKRAKWSRPAQAVLGLARWVSGHVPHRTIAVSQALADFYTETYGRAATYIPNGAPNVSKLPLGDLADELGIGTRPYVLFVGRLVPEKRPDLLIEAFKRSNLDADLVIVGGSSHTDDFVDDLTAAAAADDRIVMTGYRYGDELTALYSSAAAFALPSALEGLPLTLLEGIAYDLPIVASNIAPNVEVLGATGPGRQVVEVDDLDDLTRGLERVVTEPESDPAAAAAFRSALLDHYSWDRATEATLNVYQQALGLT